MSPHGTSVALAEVGNQRLLLARPLKEQDVVNAYLFFLGRPPEDPSAIDQKLGLSREHLISQFVTSGEFEDHVVAPITGGMPPSKQGFGDPPAPAVLGWLAGFIPLSKAAIERLPRAPSWISAYDILFGDPGIGEMLPSLKPFCTPSRFAEELRRLSIRLDERAPAGEILEASGLVVRGWAIDHTAPNVSIGVELWVDGAFVAAAIADEFRRELQEKFASGGKHGFTFQGFSSPNPYSGRPVTVEVRDSASKISFGSRIVSWRPERDASHLLDLVQQMDAARTLLERIELKLSDLSGAFGFSLAFYNDYYKNYYNLTPKQERSYIDAADAFMFPVSFTVLIVTPPRPESVLARTLKSLRDQIYRKFDVVVVGAEQDAAKAAALALSTVTTTEDDRPPVTGGYGVIIDAGDELAADALASLAAAVQADRPRLLYTDCDTVVVSPRGERHFQSPELRPDYDPDLLLQTPYMGEVLAIEKSALAGVLSGGGSLRREKRGDLVLRVLDHTRYEAVLHVPRVLYHRDPGAERLDPMSYGSAISDALSRRDLDAVVVSDTENFTPAAATPRVRWALKANLKAAIIVPTRDRLDLLGPCLASILASKSANSVDMEVVVVDNASTSAATRRFLSSMDFAGSIRLLEYDAEFNWSAINNFAARSINADVLIFLNNDTVVLSKDWCEELCAQAMRPEVGAVGARLLYEDGTIQHAGIILSNGAICHEGAGVPANDAGYLGRHSVVRRAAAVTGACLATRSDVFGRMGGFDEDKLAIEANDIDYCLRLRRAGLSIIYDPYCTLYHFESKSRGQTSLDEARRQKADQELAALKRRWGADLGGDPYYNRHFDRASRPFTKLGPPPVF